MNPETVRYLITAVNQHLEAFMVTEGEARRGLEHELHQVEEELRNGERAILAGVVSETTAALVQDREAQRRLLKERLVGLEARRRTRPLRADAGTITAQMARLDDLLRRDVPRANAFLRTHVAPITCTFPSLADVPGWYGSRTEQMTLGLCPRLRGRLTLNTSGAVRKSTAGRSPL